MNILFCWADNEGEWNCSEWRCQIPHDAINTLEGHQAKLVPLNTIALMKPEGEALGEWADVIVIQRNMAGVSLTMVEYWRAKGKVVVLDLDDDYRHMPPDVTTYTYWILGIMRREGKEIEMAIPPIRQMEWGAKLVNAITTPSAQIAYDWSSYNHTYVVPNYIDYKRYNYREIDTPINIGWGGSLSHLKSFKESGAISAVNRILTKYNKINFVAIGDPAIYGHIKINPDRKKFIPWCPVKEWPAILTANIDIGLAPLEGDYDKRRSWIKVLEYTASGIPCVATGYPMYNELWSTSSIRVDNRPKYWEDALTEIIENFSEIKSYAIRERDNNAGIYDAALNAQKLIDIYEDIRKETT
jgi:glycosyltransferase involved in cell wall biosynthesis